MCQIFLASQKEVCMLTLLYKLLASLFCFGFTCFLFYVFHRMNKSAIVELGYRSQTHLRKPQSKKLPLWDRVLYWHLCKDAKQKHGEVWLYFGCNVLTCLLWAFSPVLCILCICYMDLRNLILRELGYTLGCLFLIILVRFSLDLMFLPSERKRYGLDHKQKKK